MCVIVNKRVRSILGVRSRLLHVDSSDPAIAREDLFNLFLRWKLSIDLESYKEGRAVQVSKVIVGEVAHYLRALIVVRKLDF